jgi:hypothetical protein
LRALRVSTTTAQLALPVDPVEQCWWRLPADARAVVVTLLARLIARGVIVEPTGGDGDG